MKILSRTILAFSFVAPVLTNAAGVNTTYIMNYSNSIVNIINFYLVPILLSVAFIVFLYGVYKNFILGAESGEAHTAGSKFVATGLIGFVIILSLWALVNIVGSTLVGSSGASNNRPSPPIF